MKNRKKYISFILTLIFVFNLIPIVKVSASDELSDINIISDTLVTLDAAKNWARSKGATETFVSLADYYWKFSKSNGGVNPAVAFVQAAKETGYGNFKGVINESYKNPCGLKTVDGGSDDNPNAHQKFENWEQGVQAHLDHLAVYAGVKGYPRSNSFDPRRYKVTPGGAKTVVGLGGKWAPSKTYGNEIMTMYNQVVNESNNPRLNGEITTPTQFAKVSNKTMTVTGWAIADSGVKTVQIYVNGVYKGEKAPSIETSDINVKYPGHLNAATSGYSIDVKIADMSVGYNVIVARTVANDGSIKDAGRTIYIDKLESKGEITSPSQFARISGKSMTVTGWAIAESGVNEVQIFVDGVYKDKVVPNKSTPDIQKAYSKYPNASASGYEKTFDISDISGGYKVIIARTIGKDGSIKDAGRTVYIDKLESKGEIISPVQFAKVSGSKMTVTGWAIADSGVNEVQIFIDGVYMDKVVPSKSTPDIQKAYSNYPNASISGYEKNIDISNVSEGNKVIIARTVAKDGSIKDAGRTVYIDRQESKGEMTSPVQFAKVSVNSLTVTGWAIADSGVNEVQIFVDGVYKDKVVPNKSTPDVQKAYPNYSNASTSGYEKTVDISNISKGYKVIIARIVAKDGSIKDVGRTVYIDKLESKGEIISPVQFAKVSGKNMTVTGWAVAGSGVKEVQIFVDGVYIDKVVPNKSTPDIQKAYSNYPNAGTSGYEKSIDISNVSEGNKVIVARTVANDGSINDAGRTVFIDKLETKGEITTPIQFEKVRGNSMTISGWTLAYSGVREIQVYVDNKLMKVTSPNKSTPNIKEEFPNYVGAETSGYEVNVDIPDIDTGYKVIIVRTIAKDGSIKDAGRTFLRRGKLLVVLDPGHALGKDDGAYASYNNTLYNNKRYNGTYCERTLNMSIATKTKAELEARGYSVVLTRSELTQAISLNQSLSDRANLANSLDADLFISIHNNASSSIDAYGTEVYYTYNSPDGDFPQQNSDKLAKSSSLANVLTNAVSSSAGLYNRGSNSANFFVLRNTKMPSVLIECGFITNPVEAGSLSDENKQLRIASAISDNIKNVAI